MKMLPAALLMSLLILPAGADPVDLGTVKLKDGTQLEQVRMIKVEPDGLRLEHRDGVGKVRMEDLPAELSQRFSLDEATAAAWRQAEKKRLDDEAETRRRARTQQLMEASRADQEAQARAKRLAIFDEIKTGAFNYAALDDQLRTQIQLWKDAGREDLAARFEEDRQLLKQQEIARPAAALEAEKQALARRVESLQSEVSAAQNRPTTTTLVVDSNVGFNRGIDPFWTRFYTSPSYIVPAPVVINPPVYCPPGYRPPGHPTPVPIRPPVIKPIPQPRPPAWNTGNPIHGEHLYRKK